MHFPCLSELTDISKFPFLIKTSHQEYMSTASVGGDYESSIIYTMCLWTNGSIDSLRSDIYSTNKI